MEAIIGVISWIIGIAIGGIILVLCLLVLFWLFKFLCTIHAEIVAEKIGEVLESRGIGMLPSENEE